MSEKWIHNMTNDELLVRERQCVEAAESFLRMAAVARHIRIGRDATAMLATAKAAQQRALNGTCSCPGPAGTCDVHQMGGRDA